MDKDFSDKFDTSDGDDDIAILSPISLSQADEDDLSEVPGVEVLDTIRYKPDGHYLTIPDYEGPNHIVEDYCYLLPQSGRKSSETIEILGPGLTPVPVLNEHAEANQAVKAAPKRPTSSEKLLRRREFHRKCVLHFRYPSHLHTDGTKQRQKSYLKIPESFQPRTRYGKEPRVQATKNTPAKNKGWAHFPVYPPRARHKDTMCEIIRLVDTLDLAVQATPTTSDSSIQCCPQMQDTGVQYPRVRKYEVGCQTISPKCCDTGVQNVPKMANKMEETSVRILFFPEINTQHNSTQTELEDMVNEDGRGGRSGTLPVVTLDSPEGSRRLIQSFSQDE